VRSLTPVLRACGVAALLLLLGVPAWSDDQSDKQKAIADIEAQLKKLSADLEKIKGEPAKAAAAASPEGAIPAQWVSALNWRSIGPATMGGRITAISVFPSDPSTYWVATASGGLLKTENNGITFVHQFDKERTVSIGDVCVAPSDKNVVWVGTGEANPRNSVSYGDGVYKSTDGGKKWQNMGLRETYQTGKVVVHPKDPNTVYVGALGRCYGPNPERGVFKTSDGGKTWDKVLYLDANTGCVDLMMHPSEPDTLIAALWERRRDGFDSYVGEKPPDGIDGYDPIVKYGANGGLYRTTDAGKNWAKLTKGLPTVKTGRIGIDWYQKDPKVLFAIFDTEKIGMGVTPPPPVYLGVQGEDGDGGARLTSVTESTPGGKAGLKSGDVITRANDKKIEAYGDLVAVIRVGKPGDEVKLQVKRGGETTDVTVKLEKRPDAEAQPGGPLGFGFRPETSEEGLRVPTIDKDSAAAKAGLVEGDLIVSVEGQKIEGFRDLIELAGQFRSEKQAGDKVKVTVKRGDATKEVTLPLEPMQLGRGGGPAMLTLGFRPEAAEGGVRVSALAEDAANAKAGLKEGDVITAVDGKKFENLREYMQALNTNRKAGDKVPVTVQRGDDKKELTLTLESGGGGGFGSRRPAGRPYGADLYGQIENAQGRQGPDGYQTGGVYKSTDGGESWERINSVNPRPMYFSVVRVDPADDKKLYVLGINLYASTDGGKSFRTYGNRNLHSDQHALWIDPKDGRHMLVGTDGGAYVTYDRMANWEHLANMALGQFYHVAVDSKRPYNVYGGLQDNGSWGGPSRTLRGSGPVNEDWLFVSGGDGFVCRVDPDDPDVVYSESQDGRISRRNLRTGEGGAIRPRGGSARFNWNTPFILSSHNPRIVYVGGEKVYRSVKQGADLKAISPEITKSKRGTATALSESPRNPDVLWVGSDDGALFVTRDGGQKWDNVYDKLGAPPGRWVATIEASRFAEGRAYVALDAHRSDDDKPYLFMTEDYGKTWKNIGNGLPPFGSTRCLREDVVNQNLLLCGTEFAVFASIDRGGYWTKINNNLPTVAVHELAIHPTAGEVVAATHGRSLWIADITALRQMKPEVVKAPAHLFAPNTAVKWRTEPARGSQGMGFGGAKKFYGTNPPDGAAIYYSFATKPEKATLRVYDYAGQMVRELPVKKEVGLFKAQWDLTRPSLQSAFNLSAGTELPETVIRRPGGVFAIPVPPGSYRVVLAADGKELSQPLRIEADPNASANGIAAGGGEDQ
jgi:S1-C subfamily serine protease/photosystem II stability/assembly factor-like uncharacterized protein